ncbi:MAG TPA: RNA-binding protein [Chromatiales bacterium]|nr:RNA-binding protein [Chromatiales bacterium]
MKKMWVGNLSADASEDSVTELFSQFGKVRSIKLAKDVFTGKCRGFAFIEMEGHEARAAIAELNGKVLNGDRPIKVRFEDSTRKRSHRRR